MSKTPSWKCDICKKVFEDGEDPGGYRRAGENGFEIFIPIPSEELNLGWKFKFEDVCADCRFNLATLIIGLIK